MLGICVSKKTLECFEAKISSKVQEELLNFLDEDDAPFSMVSLDNFNESQSTRRSGMVLGPIGLMAPLLHV